MSYTFTTDLLGPKAEVEGTFSPAEPETLTDPGCSAEFEIESITINDEEFEVDSLSIETLETIEQLAFDDAHNNYDPY